MKLRETDRDVTYAEQLGGGDAPITLINIFTMSSDDVDAFLRAWTDDAAFMKRQPGFIRTQLHRGTQGSATFVNIATWESTAALRAAFTAPDFQAGDGALPGERRGRPARLRPCRRARYLPA